MAEKFGGVDVRWGGVVHVAVATRDWRGGSFNIEDEWGWVWTKIHCKKFNFGHEIRFLSIWDFSQIFVRFFSMRISSNIYEIFLKSWDLSHKVMRIFHLHEIFLKYIWDFSLGVFPIISRRFFSNCEKYLIKQWEFLVVYKRYSSYIKENCCLHRKHIDLGLKLRWFGN